VSSGGGGRNTYPSLARHPYQLWCHDCRAWEAINVDGPSSTGEHFFDCARCGSTILCDECGAEFGTHHECSPRQP
jgi:Zn finger protein HypA/HybF involved in hydrogenase expression